MVQPERELTILVYTPQFSDMYHGSMMLECYRVAQCENIKLQIAKCTGHSTRDRLYISEDIDGIIAFPNSITLELVRDIKLLNKPFVSLGNDYFPIEVDTIMPSYRSGMKEIRTHFNEFDMTKIAFCGDMGNNIHRNMYQSLQNAYEQNPVSLFNLASKGHQAFSQKRWFDKEIQADGIVFASDCLAISFMKAFERFEQPENTRPAIIGVGNSLTGSEGPYWLTTLDLNFVEFARESIARIKALVNGSPERARPNYITPSLIVRHSSDPRCPAITERPVFSLDYQASQLASPVQQYGHESPISLSVKGIQGIHTFSDMFGQCFSWVALLECKSRRNGGWTISVKAYSTYNEELQHFQDLHDSFDVPGSGFHEVLSRLGNIESGAVVRHLGFGWNKDKFGVLVVCNNEPYKLEIARLSMFDNYLELCVKSSSELINQFFTHATHKIDKTPEPTATTVAPAYSWEWDLTNNKITWSEETLTLLGVSKKSQAAPSFFEFIHQDDERMVRAHLKYHLEYQVPLNIQYRLVRQDQKVFWVEATSSKTILSSKKTSLFTGELKLINEQSVSSDSPEFALQTNNILRRAEFYLHIEQQQSSGLLINVGILTIELNSFDNVLKAMGFKAASKFRRQVIEMIQDRIGQRGVIGLLSDKEVSIYCDYEHYSEFKQLGRDLITLNSETIDVDGNEISASICIGAAISPDDAISLEGTLEGTLQRSGIALSKAKENQNLEFYLFNSSIQTQQSYSQFSVESKLRKAIHNGELELFYQPQINIHTKQLVGVEALVRWYSTDLGHVSPGEFIPIAEQSGLIHRLGDWVIEKAIADMASWELFAPDNNVQVSINFASGQLADPDLPERLKQLVQTHQVDPARITMEITESSIITDLTQTRAMLTQLRQQGFQIAMDDFGTGYSSLSQLKCIPLDTVKIDRSFVTDIENTPTDIDIIHAIYMMCTALGYKIVCEGVETQQQLTLIEKIGIDVVQGFYFDKALPSEVLRKKYFTGITSLTPMLS